ncbi:MAG: amino acid ABC transporter substrate-binding protein [Pseudomonadota bacterium]
MPLIRLLAALLLLATPAAAGPTLDRILSEKTLRIGVRTDAPPFASLVDGRPQGFSVDLCGLIAGAIVTTSKIEGLEGTMITVGAENRFDALAKGEIDILCGATTATLTRRESMAFSVPTFSTGLGAVVAADAPALLREVLIEGGPAALSQAAVAEALKAQTVGARAGTTAEDWLASGPLSKIDGIAVTPVDDHAAGIAAVAEGRLAAYFADKAILLGQLRGSAEAESFAVSKVAFTTEPYALALPRGDEDLRLVVDRALSFLYRQGAILKIYERHFGRPSPQVLLFYSMAALPE